MSDTSLALTTRMQMLKFAPESDSKHQQDNNDQLVPIIARPLREPSATRSARLPPLPEGSDKSKRYYFFGWHITPKWLTDLAPANNFPNAFAYHTSLDGIRYIRWKSGYKHAYPALALVENGEQFEGQFPGHCYQYHDGSRQQEGLCSP